MLIIHDLPTPQTTHRLNSISKHPIPHPPLHHTRSPTMAEPQLTPPPPHGDAAADARRQRQRHLAGERAGRVEQAQGVVTGDSAHRYA